MTASDSPSPHGTTSTPPPTRRTATWHDWLEGARPHTWANAVAPVIAGTGAAWSFHAAELRVSGAGLDAGGTSATEAPAHTGFVAPTALMILCAILAMIVAWTMVVGVNFANDYSDGIRGTDDERSGPLRLTGSGLVPPYKVKAATFATFGVGGVVGIVLSLISGHWWLIGVGILCVLAAWFYTGGKNPYGYRGLGEVSVFIFFGLVAVLGTEFTQLGRVTWWGLLAAVTIGSLSCAVNLANNLRDIPTDRASGKITIAVRLGDQGTRRLWIALASVPIVTTVLGAWLATPWVLLSFIALPFVVKASAPIRGGAQGKALIPVLGLTGRAMVVWAIVAACAVWLG